MIRGLFVLILSFFIGATAAIAAPFFSYEGFLTDSAGNPVGLGTPAVVPFRLEILGRNSNTSSSCPLYVEERDVTVTDGNFIVTVGAGAPSSLHPLPFETMFGKSPMTGISCTFDPSQGGAYRALGVTVDSQVLGEVILSESPRATVAGSAETLDGLSSNYFFRVVNGSNPSVIPAWSQANYQKLLDLLNTVTVSGGNSSLTGNVSGTSTGFTGVLAGDVTGTQTATTVSKLQGRNVLNIAPSAGQVLGWNHANSRWEPTTLPAATAPDWDDIGDKPNEFPPGGNAGGDLTGTFPNPTIAANAVTAVKLSSSSVTTVKIADGAITTAKLAPGSVAGQTLRYTGSSWVATKLFHSDLVNGFGSTPWPVTQCAPNESMNWSTVMESFTCQAVSISETDPTVQGFAKVPPSTDFSTGGGALSLNTVPITKGGTGATTATAALNALLPAQTGNSGKILQTDGSGTSWVNMPVGTVTNVTATSPLSVATGTSTPQISLQTGGVTSTYLASASVTSAKLATDSVQSSHILDGSISTADIADGAVTANKISTVRVNQIASGSGLYLTYAPNGAVCANGETLKWSGTGWACAADSITTDASLLSSGVINSSRLPSSVVLNGGNSVGAAMTIGANDSNSFGIKTNGSTRVTITSDGRVGIGTASPSVALDVAGSMKASSLELSSLKISPNAGAGKVLTSDGSGNAAWAISPLNCGSYTKITPTVGASFCLSPLSSGTNSNLDAEIVCANVGANLCTGAQLKRACDAGELDAGVALWASGSVSGYAVTFSASNCSSAASDIATNLKKFRCCIQ